MRLCAGICTYVWESKGALCVWQRPWIAMWINGSLECGWRPLVSPTNYSTALDGIPRCNRSPTKLCRDGRSTYHLHPAFGLSNAIFSPRVLKLLLISAWLDWKWSYISQLTRTENEKDQKKYQTLIMTVPLFAQKNILGTCYLSLSQAVLHLPFLPQKNHVFYVKPVIVPGEWRQAIKCSFFLFPSLSAMRNVCVF